jgi:hypothetical protein
LTVSEHATNAAIYFLGAAVLTLQGIRFGLWLADYHSNVRTWKTVDDELLRRRGHVDGR